MPAKSCPETDCAQDDTASLAFRGSCHLSNHAPVPARTPGHGQSDCRKNVPDSHTHSGSLAGVLMVSSLPHVFLSFCAESSWTGCEVSHPLLQTPLLFLHSPLSLQCRGAPSGLPACSCSSRQQGCGVFQAADPPDSSRRSTLHASRCLPCRSPRSHCRTSPCYCANRILSNYLVILKLRVMD